MHNLREETGTMAYEPTDAWYILLTTLLIEVMLNWHLFFSLPLVYHALACVSGTRLQYLFCWCCVSDTCCRYILSLTLLLLLCFGHLFPIPFVPYSVVAVVVRALASDIFCSLLCCCGCCSGTCFRFILLLTLLPALVSDALCPLLCFGHLLPIHFVP